MNESRVTISACLVVFNEERVIEQCLQSIKDLVDEIIVVHDGECSDNTLEIARRYTNKIFVRNHIGEAEPHRAFSFSQATGEWLLQIDADEYIDTADHKRIRMLVNASMHTCNGYIFKWEMWNGQRALYFKGMQKMCLFRRASFHYYGVPHEAGSVDGTIEKVPIFLHHRPAYNNMSWGSFLKKKRRWVPVHARYFFPETTAIECFNTTIDTWVTYAQKVRVHIWWNIIGAPLKMFLGQIKNGLWTSWYGINVALQQYVYYFSLYREVKRLMRRAR